jgi:hypothetical protein
MSAILLRQNSQIIRGEVIEVLKKRLVILLGLKLSYQKKGGEQLMIEF